MYKWKWIFKRYALTLFMSFMIVLVLVLVCGFSMYRVAANMLHEETERLNEKVISEATASVDSKLKTASYYILKAAYNESIRSIAMDDYNGKFLTPLKKYKAHLVIDNMYQDTYKDTFVYFLNSDYVVSATHPSTSRVMYDRTNYSGSELDFDVLQSLTLTAKKGEFFALDNTIAVACTVPTLYYKIPSALSVCVIYPEDLIDQIGRDIGSDAAFTIQNANGDIIFTYGNSEKEASFSELIRKTRFSDYTGLTYTYSIGSASYKSRLHSFRYTIFISMGLFFLFGTLLIFLLTRFNYKPIGTLVQNAEPDKEISRREGEFVYLRRILTSYIEEHNRYNHVLKDQFIRKAVQGLHKCEENPASEFSRFGIELISDSFMTIAIAAELGEDELSGSISEREEILTREYDGLLQEANIAHEGFFICIQPGRYAYILNIHAEDYGRVISSLPDFQARIVSNYYVEFFVAASLCRNGWQGLSDSFQSASDLLSLRSVKGRACIATEEEEKQFVFSYSFSNRNHAKDIILSYIHTGKPTPEEVVAKISDECCPEGFHLTSEFLCYSDDCYRLIKEVCAQFALSESICQPLNTCDNLPEFNDSMAAALSKIRSSVDESSNVQTVGLDEEICNQIVAYINEHLSDCDLCPDMVGKHFSRSGQYLSKQFKLVKGITIAAQISDSRIELVKKLLRSTDENIQTISVKAGFIGASAMNRVFKKATDMVPGTYRKLYNEIRRYENES